MCVCVCVCVCRKQNGKAYMPQTTLEDWDEEMLRGEVANRRAGGRGKWSLKTGRSAVLLSSWVPQTSHLSF